MKKVKPSLINKNRKCIYCRYFKSKIKLPFNINLYNICKLDNRKININGHCNKFSWSGDIVDMPADLNVSGKHYCRRCQHVLKDPESIARGFGPDCYKQYLKDINNKSKRLF